MTDFPSYTGPDCGSIRGAQEHHRAGEPLCELCQRWSDERHASTRVPAGSRCGTPAGAQMHRQLGEKVCERCAPGRKPKPPKPLTGRHIVLLALAAHELLHVDPHGEWRDPSGRCVSGLVFELGERRLLGLEFLESGLFVTEAGCAELASWRPTQD